MLFRVYFRLCRAAVGSEVPIIGLAMSFSFLRKNETCAQLLALLDLLRSPRSLRSG